MAQDNLEGLIQILSALVPTNDNPRAFITFAEYIKGADQTFDNIDDLIAFHPNRMRKGMRARVIDYPLPGNVADFVMAADPSTLLDGNNDSTITNSNYGDYWDLIDERGTTVGFQRVYEYAPDAVGGGAPPFPYTDDPAFEANWDPVYDATKNHKWIRFRDDDVDVNVDGIFDNWTAPIAINRSYEGGDYIDIRFRREATDNTVHTATGTMTNAKYYIVLQGSVTNTTDNVINFKGKIFQYDSGKSYTFSTGPNGQVQEFVAPISRTLNGTPNNEPVGWTDTVPAGTDQLWKATAQKSAYGQLKSSWIVTRVQENPNYVRYSSSPSPHPDTIVGVDVDATLASQGDTDLLAEGWSSVYSSQTFMATREDDQNPSSPKYTTWTVQKISEESGEYIDRVFKLFPIGLDPDSVLVSPPTTRDATTEGWSDQPLQETINEINYYSEARKFVDGTLKSSWSKPFPYTGKDVLSDTITSNLGDNFKSDQNGAAVPAEIVLTAKLFRGDVKLWEDSAASITYSWKKVYDNGAVVDVSPTAGTGEFHTKAATGGAPGVGEFLANQRVGIEPTAVTGKAVFECTQTLNPGGGAPVLTFVDTFDILDITDGLDFKALSARADNKLVVWDLVNTVFGPETSVLSVFQSNLPTGNTFYWYRSTDGGLSWVELTAADDNHTFPNGVNGSELVVEFLKGASTTAVTDIVFTVPGTGGEAQITSALNGLPAMNVSDEFLIKNHPVAANNGLYVVDVVNTSTSDYDVSKIGTAASVPVADTAEAADIETTLSKIFPTDESKAEAKYAVTNTQADPKTADYTTKFSDYITLAKLGSSAAGVPGTSPVSILLSNESHTIALDQSSGNPLAGQITATGTAITTVEVYQGTTKLDYNVDYGAGDIAVSTLSVDNGDVNDVTFNWQQNGTNFDVFVATWNGVDSPRNAVAKIAVTIGGTTYSKSFTINSTLDAPGALILDIDSNKGFSFVPSDRLDKTLTGIIYNNNVVDTTDDWTYRWLLNDVQVKAKALYSVGGHQYTLQSTSIQGGGYLTCEIYTSPGDVLTRERTVYIQDITDAKRYLLYYDYGSDQDSNEPLSTPTTPTPSTVATFANEPTPDYPATPTGTPGWYRNPGTWTYWSSEGIEDEAKALNFTTPVRIRGEKGDQGLAGGFFIEQYNENGGITITPPTKPIAYPDTGNGWVLALPPTADVIWGSRTLADSGGTPINNGNWSEPYLITGVGGADGAAGATGATGPGYSNIVDLGIAGDGNRDIRFIGSGGNSNVDIEVPQGPTGPQGVTDGIQWYRRARGGNSGGTPPAMGSYQSWVYIDTGDTTTKQLKLQGFVTCKGGPWMSMQFATNTTASLAGRSNLVTRQHYSEFSTRTTQFVQNLYTTTAQRYIIFTFSNQGNNWDYYDYGLEVFRLD